MRIGNIHIDRPLALAPMEAVTNRPFRLMCKEHGADLFYTEFANCEALVRDVKKILAKIRVADDERPVGIQIYGSSADSMERASAMAEEAEPDFIDINAGCWVKKIAMRGDGAGLLRDLDRFERIVKAVVKATTLPVTVKTRLGWDADSICILDVARMVEANGAAALTVHCRTRSQGYKGEADWSWLEAVKKVCSIPLIGNGDVKTADDAKRMFETGCDGIMIGRGAICNPWIFRQTKHLLETGEYLPLPSLPQRVEQCLYHLKAEADFHGERRAVLEHRKHYSGYLKGYRGVARLRAELMQFTEVAPIEERLRRYVADYEECTEPDENVGGE